MTRYRRRYEPSDPNKPDDAPSASAVAWPVRARNSRRCMAIFLLASWRPFDITLLG